ncbi:MAG TPA: AMP-binding protein [Acidimicrobiales bacterium]|nr:AMP-binding protein [Acidimicrobiales bacterium]
MRLREGEAYEAMSVVRRPLTVGDVLAPALTQDPTREALVGADRRFTYEQLDRAADQAGAALHGLGVGRGDVVAVSLPNETDVVVGFHATLRLGAVWLGVNRNLAPPEKRFVLADAGARVLIADEDVVDGLASTAAIGDRGLRIVTSGGDAGEWQRLVASSGGTYPRAQPRPDDPAGIAYTSGTTGRPKGVVHSHRNLLLPGAVLGESRGYGPDLRRGDCAALTILNLQVTGTLLTAQAGGTQVVMDRVDAAGIARWVGDERITSWFGVPTMLHDLAGSPEVTPEQLASLEDVWTGGTYLPDTVRARFEARFGKSVHATYGLTEVPTVVTIEPRTGERVDGSSGRALAHLTVEIRDDDDKVLPVGHLGEVTVRAHEDGPWADAYRPMLGYQGEIAAADALRDGVLYTGDVGELDEHGHLFVRDRRKSIIVRGGANVYPAEVERVLLQHPGVVGAAVVGFPDARLGQRVAAAVELGPGTRLEPEVLQEHCRREIARYKVPERWRFEHLPRNAMGKVSRVEVETWFAQPPGLDDRSG